MLHERRIDADAGIANRDDQPLCMILTVIESDRHSNFPRRGKLDGVANQIEEDLLEP